MKPFTVEDRATWPDVLTAEETAAIYRRSVGGLKKAIQLGRFVPSPYQKQPYRWRKSDVLRHLDGAFARAAYPRSA